jgi:hypothetical protein
MVERTRVCGRPLAGLLATGKNSRISHGGMTRAGRRPGVAHHLRQKLWAHVPYAAQIRCAAKRKRQ